MKCESNEPKKCYSTISNCLDIEMQLLARAKTIIIELTKLGFCIRYNKIKQSLVIQSQ